MIARAAPALTVLAAALWLVVALLAAPAAGQGTVADPPDYQTSLAVYDAQASAVERRLGERGLTNATLQEMIATLVAQREALPDQQQRIADDIAPITRQLEALGPQPPEGTTESEDIARERGALNAALAELEATRLRLDQADARAAALVDRINILRRELLADLLLTREQSPLNPQVAATAVAGLFTLVADLGREVRLRMTAETMAPVAVALRLLTPILLIALTTAALLVFRRRVLLWIDGHVSAELPDGSKVAVGLGLAVARLVFPAIGLGIILGIAASSGLLGSQGQALVAGLARVAGLAIAAYALAGCYFAPYQPNLRLSHLDDASARAAHRWTLALAVIYGLDRMLVENLDGIDLPLETNIVVNFTLLVAGALALWQFERAIGRVPTKEAAQDEPEEEDEEEVEERALTPLLITFARMLLLAVAIAAPMLALTGYFAASRFVFFNPLATASLIGLFVLIFAIVRFSADAAVQAMKPAEAQATPDLAAQEAPRSIRLIPVLIGFILIAAAGPLIAMIWGAESGDLLAAWQIMRAGIAVGEVTIDPLDFVAFLVVFGLVSLLFRLIQAVLRRSVLPVMGIDAGARAAIVAGIGYVGFAVAGLMAVAAVGLDLSNLAIVAGALSVGIGFGLQNVVNNFVSGLILLVERPIKVGDWIELPSGMGYVKQINVRSTVIETFDRAALIVPNAELVSSTVVNWTHTNLHGRVIVPVKVAMEADPRAVEAILLEVARQHPMVLRRPQPFVLFTGYSDYALTMELRAILRDVNWVLNIRSDMYFEIHRRLVEAGIEVPVQQARVTLGAAPAGQMPGLPGTPMSPRHAPGAPQEAPRRQPPAGAEGVGLDADGGGDGR